jgi:zinc transport system ATP-binding protein
MSGLVGHLASGLAAADRASDAPAPLARCRALEVGYRGRALLPAFTTAIGAGEIMLVVGRNGSGKSTFARTLLGLMSPVAGAVERAASRLSYVPQAAAIDPAVPLRVRDLVGWGRLRGGRFLVPWLRQADRDACRRAMDDMAVGDLAGRRLAELSGGQLQRVLLARMLAGDSQLAVLDEPTAAMDAVSELAAFRRLRELAHERGIGIVVITHEVAVATPFADSIAFFDPDHDGGRVDVGSAAEIAALPRFRALFGRVETREAGSAA